MGIVKDTRNSNDYLNHGFTYEPKMMGYSNIYVLKNDYHLEVLITNDAELSLFNDNGMIVENIVLNIKGMSSWDVIDLLDERVDRMLKEHNL